MKTSQPNVINYAEHAVDILERAVELMDASRGFALVTSLAIEGGAARDTGSLALVDDRGEMTGYLSNGCIDKDIQHQAIMALENRTPVVVRYGEGSRFVDLKLPCGGALILLIDPSPDPETLRQAHAKLTARKPAQLTFTPPQDTKGGPVLLPATITYAPKFRLVLAGRGAIFRAMAQAGQAGGFDIALLSPDTDDLEAVAELSEHPVQHLKTPDTAPDLSVLDDHSAFLTLFHDHDWEPHLLAAALRSPAHYIGSLGSRRTHAMRLETLRLLGVREPDLERLNGPIGLVPSLRNASFIAVSALAEIVGVCPASITQSAAPTPRRKSA